MAGATKPIQAATIVLATKHNYGGKHGGGIKANGDDNNGDHNEANAR